MPQGELARRTGIAQSTISAIENDRINLVVRPPAVIARALCCRAARTATGSQFPVPVTYSASSLVRASASSFFSSSETFG